MVEISLNIKNEKDFRTNEVYKSLRTNIEFTGEENRVILFTSCIPNEGKSTVSQSLAAAIAESGKKVLLIDADMRNSVFLGKYQITKEVQGLSHYLSGQAKMKDIICRSNESDLYVIFSGPFPPNPTELLGSERFAALIQEGRKIFDYIIIDTPPLGRVIDSAVIAKNCDAAVLVIAANTTSYKFARSVKEQLYKSECKILGVVMNKMNMKQNKYYGHYYGHYGEK